MYAFKKGGVGMAYLQYTVRGISPAIDCSIRQGAKAQAKSLNQFLLDTLSAGLGFFSRKPRNEPLLSLANTWVSDPEADKALDEMRAIDADLWK